MTRHDGWRDVAEGAAGVAVMAAALLTPFSRGRRGSWGVGAHRRCASCPSSRAALVAYMAPVPVPGDARQEKPPHPGGPTRSRDRWMAASWLFLVEPADPARCRVISRYRCGTSGDLLSRLRFGPAVVEPVSFAMDRRMLICN